MLVGLAASSVSSAASFEYGNLVADIPVGWTSVEAVVPGSTVVAFYAGEDPEETESALIWIESLPMGAVTVEEFVRTVIASSGMTGQQIRSQETTPSYSSLTVNAEIGNESVVATFIGFRRDERLYAYGYLADPSTFSAMNGMRRPLIAFNGGKDLEAVSENAPAPDTVLASSGRHRLTQAKVAGVIAFAEFLAVTHISDVDRKALRQQMIDEYPTASQTDIEAYDDVLVLMNELATADPIERARFRRDLHNQLYFDVQRAPEDNDVMNVVYQYNPVLGADEQLGLVITQSAFDALLASNSFIATRAGFDPITGQQRASAAGDLKREFDSLSEKSKRYLNDSEVNWLKVITAWPLWNKQEREDNLRLVGVGRISTPDQVG